MRTVQFGGMLLALSVAFGPAAGQEKKDKPEPDLTTKAAEADPDFKVQGEYEGTAGGKKAAAQVVAKGSGKFEVYILGGGLPGAGWDTKTRQKIAGVTKDGKVTFDGKDASGTIADGTLTGKVG